MLVEDKTLPGSVIIFKAGDSLSLFANFYLQILKISCGVPQDYILESLLFL